MPIQAHYVSNREAEGITGIAVVIDVIRAFTTAAWAFHRGVERIVLTDDLTEALQLKQRIPGSLAMKDAQPEPGFDLTNSPAQMRDHPDLKGLTIVQRTTHGTIGAVAARKATVLYCASFLCASATANALRQQQADAVWFVVTGEDGTADEDLACAQFIAALVDDPSTPSDPFMARVGATDTAARIRAVAATGSRAADPDDIDLCMQADRFDFTMRASEEDGLLVLRRA